MKFPSLTSHALRWLSMLALAALVACGGTSGRQLPAVFSSSLSGAEETPPVDSPGKGVGVLVFHPQDRSFTATVVAAGFTETDAHIHEGPPGVPGPIIFPLTRKPGGVEWKATGTLTPAQETTLRNGGYYFNVHSPSNPNGEIRGQITERALSQDQQRMLQERLQQAQQAIQQAQQAQQAAPPTAPTGTPGTTGTGTAASS